MTNPVTQILLLKAIDWKVNPSITHMQCPAIKRFSACTCPA